MIDRIGVWQAEGSNFESIDRAMALLSLKGASRFISIGPEAPHLGEYLEWKCSQDRIVELKEAEQFLLDKAESAVSWDVPTAISPLDFGTDAAASCVMRSIELNGRVEQGAVKTIELLGGMVLCIAQREQYLDSEDYDNARLVIAGEGAPRLEETDKGVLVHTGALALGVCCLVSYNGKLLELDALDLKQGESVYKQRCALGARNKVNVL